MTTTTIPLVRTQKNYNNSNNNNKNSGDGGIRKKQKDNHRGVAKNTAIKKHSFDYDNNKAKQQKLLDHHPTIRIIPELHSKNVMEQIDRCVDRMKSYPLAVDTLHNALQQLYMDPTNIHLYTIDTKKTMYQKHLQNVPGTEHLLKVLQYHYEPTSKQQLLVLEPTQLDLQLVAYAIKVLDIIRNEESEYLVVKQTILFQKEMNTIVSIKEIDWTKEEKEKRLYHKNHSVPEAPQGLGALIQIQLGSGTTILRKFNSDDTLQDVLHWIGTHGSQIYEKLVRTNEWVLVDRNHSNYRQYYHTTTNNHNKYHTNHDEFSPIIDCQPVNARHTLQYIGCWPTGYLEIRPKQQQRYCNDDDQKEVVTTTTTTTTILSAKQPSTSTTNLNSIRCDNNKTTTTTTNNSTIHNHKENSHHTSASPNHRRLIGVIS